MSLSQKIAAALDATQTPGALPCQIRAADGDHDLSLDMTACGPVGFAFWTLCFSTPGRAGLTPEALRRWGDRLASRVTYLMEPLVVLEHDALVGEVELRSELPTSRGEVRSYYEIVLNHDAKLTLTRIAFDEPSRRRHPAQCQMTREVLERLIDDFVWSVD
jgi:hypothetical protein